MGKENKYRGGHVDSDTGNVYINDKSNYPRKKGEIDKETSDVYSSSGGIFDIRVKKLGNTEGKTYYRDYTFLFGTAHGEEKAGYINEKGEIISINNFTKTERVIGELRGKPENAFAYFSTRFEELEKKIYEFVEECEKIPDKASLLLKIRHQYNILENYNAIGDFEKLGKEIKYLEDESQKEWNDRYNLKNNLLNQALCLTDYSSDFYDARFIFFKLNKEWKEAGPLPGEEAKDLNKQWFNNSKKFFELAESQENERINSKKEIISEAQCLIDGDDFKMIGEKLKELSDNYKEIGKIFDIDKRQEIDDKFYGLIKSFSERKKEHFNLVKKEKEEIIEEIKEIIDSDENWKNKDGKIKELKNNFKNLGFCGDKEDEQEMWQILKDMIASYREKKETFFKKRDEESDTSITNKELIIEELIETIDSGLSWKEKNEIVKELSEKFKDTGRIYNKEKNDELWERFKEIKQNYFDKRTSFFENRNKEDTEAINEREEIIRELNNAIDSGLSWKEKNEIVKELSEKFKDASRIYNKEKSDELWEEFNSLKQSYYEDRTTFFKEKRIESIEWKKSKIEELEEKINHWQDVINNLNPGGRAEEIEEVMNEKISNAEERIETLEKEIEDLESR